MVIELTPSLIGCVISCANHPFDLVCGSGECVINLPEATLVDSGEIGHCLGTKVGKFELFGLTAGKASKVGAPLTEKCHSDFECRLQDDAMANGYNLFIYGVLKAPWRPRLPAPCPALPGHGTVQAVGPDN